MLRQQDMATDNYAKFSFNPAGIATKKCNFTKPFAYGISFPGPLSRALPLGPTGWFATPNFLQLAPHLYNTSRAPDCKKTINALYISATQSISVQLNWPWLIQHSPCMRYRPNTFVLS